MLEKGKVKILLYDSQALARSGIRNLIEQQGIYEIVAEAETGRQVLERTRAFKPEVVILDVVMAELNGYDATRQIRSVCSETKVVVLSEYKNKRYVENIFRAGASAYALKEEGPEELLKAIHSVMAGHQYLSPELGGMILNEWVHHPALLDCEDPLTPREREVLQLIAEGMTSKDIATQLHVSVKTVEAQRRSISEKLNISNIAGLTKYAVREGLTPLMID